MPSMSKSETSSIDNVAVSVVASSPIWSKPGTLELIRSIVSLMKLRNASGCSDSPKPAISFVSSNRSLQVATLSVDDLLYISKIIFQLKGGLRSSMGYIGARNLSQISKNAKFIKITKAGFYESMVHSVEMTQKTINYKL